MEPIVTLSIYKNRQWTTNTYSMKSILLNNEKSLTLQFLPTTTIVSPETFTCQKNYLIIIDLNIISKFIRLADHKKRDVVKSVPVKRGLVDFNITFEESDSYFDFLIHIIPKFLRAVDYVNIFSGYYYNLSDMKCPVFRADKIRSFRDWCICERDDGRKMDVCFEQRPNVFVRRSMEICGGGGRGRRSFVSSCFQRFHFYGSLAPFGYMILDGRECFDRKEILFNIFQVLELQLNRSKEVLFSDPVSSIMILYTITEDVLKLGMNTCSNQSFTFNHLLKISKYSEVKWIRNLSLVADTRRSFYRNKFAHTNLEKKNRSKLFDVNFRLFQILACVKIVVQRMFLEIRENETKIYPQLPFMMKRKKEILDMIAETSRIIDLEKKEGKEICFYFLNYEKEQMNRTIFRCTRCNELIVEGKDIIDMVFYGEVGTAVCTKEVSNKTVSNPSFVKNIFSRDDFNWNVYLQKYCDSMYCRNCRLFIGRILSGIEQKGRFYQFTITSLRGENKLYGIRGKSIQIEKISVKEVLEKHLENKSRIDEVKKLLMMNFDMSRFKESHQKAFVIYIMNRSWKNLLLELSRKRVKDFITDECFEEVRLKMNDLLFEWCISDAFKMRVVSENYRNLTERFGKKEIECSNLKKTNEKLEVELVLLKKRMEELEKKSEIWEEKEEVEVEGESDEEGK